MKKTNRRKPTAKPKQEKKPKGKKQAKIAKSKSFAAGTSIIVTKPQVGARVQSYIDLDDAVMVVVTKLEPPKYRIQATVT